MLYPATSDCIFGWTFLSLTARCGVVPYIEAKASRDCLVQKLEGEMWPLLLDAVQASNSTHYPPEYYLVPNPDSVACLLSIGADPNFKITETRQHRALRGHEDLAKTVWGVAMWCMWSSFQPNFKLESPWLEIATSMIQHGADLKKGTIHAAIKPGEFDNKFEAFYNGLSGIRRQWRTQGRSSWLPWV